jgi:hypothetical protein
MDTAALKTVSQRGTDELRANLFSLAQACPVDKLNPADCPLYLLRKMKPRQQRQWFNALNEDDLVFLATYHHVCMNIKVALKSDKNFP